jgi:hypothetical protein
MDRGFHSSLLLSKFIQQAENSADFFPASATWWIFRDHIGLNEIDSTDGVRFLDGDALADFC